MAKIPVTLSQVGDQWFVDTIVAVSGNEIEWTVPAAAAGSGTQITNMYLQFFDNRLFKDPDNPNKTIMTHKVLRPKGKLKLYAPHLKSGDTILYALFLDGVNQFAIGNSPPTIIIK